MTLTMGVRTGQHRDFAGGMDTNDAAFPEADAAPSAPATFGGRRTTGFNTASDANPNQASLAARAVGLFVRKAG